MTDSIAAMLKLFRKRCPCGGKHSTDTVCSKCNRGPHMSAADKVAYFRRYVESYHAHLELEEFHRNCEAGAFLRLRGLANAIREKQAEYPTRVRLEYNDLLTMAILLRGAPLTDAEVALACGDRDIAAARIRQEHEQYMVNLRRELGGCRPLINGNGQFNDAVTDIFGPA